MNFMTYLGRVGLVGLLLIGTVVNAAEPEPIKQEWQPTTLSEATQKKVHEGLEAYQKCLNDETKAHYNDKEDSRKLTDLILSQCESKLTLIKAAFDAEKVPDVISDRYNRSKRSRAAQQVVKVMMAAQATRSAAEKP
jgi:hypothetical protein